jgi:N utilization substance protein B
MTTNASSKSRKPSKKAKLIAARLVAVQCVYEMALSDTTSKQAFDHYKENLMGQNVEGEDYVPADLNLLSDVITGVSEKRDELRDMVLGALNGKKPEPLLQAILFCGVYELLSHQDVDVAIIINDYVNVAHGFYDKSEAGLVNAVLDRQAKNLQA